MGGDSRPCTTMSTSPLMCTYPVPFASHPCCASPQGTQDAVFAALSPTSGGSESPWASFSSPSPPSSEPTLFHMPPVREGPPARVIPPFPGTPTSMQLRDPPSNYGKHHATPGAVRVGGVPALGP